MPFCFLAAEAAAMLFKAYPTMMELNIKIMLFWHKLDNYLFVCRECIYKNKHKKAEVVFC